MATWRQDVPLPRRPVDGVCVDEATVAGSAKRGKICVVGLDLVWDLQVWIGASSSILPSKAVFDLLFCTGLG